MRKRFREGSGESLPDYELLELVLFPAIPRRDTKPLAKAILTRFGTFAEAMNAPEDLLLEVPRLGGTAVAEIKLVRAAALRPGSDGTGLHVDPRAQAKYGDLILVRSCCLLSCAKRT